MKNSKIKTAFVKMAAAAVALSMTATVLSGCTGNDSTKDEQGRTIISIGSWPSKEGKSLETMTARKVRFEEANKDVVVEPNHWTFDRKSFIAKAAGGQLPTLYYAGYTEMPEIIASEYSADLTKVLSKRGYDGMINEQVLKIVSDEEGKIKGLPMDAYVLGLAINIDMFEKAGLLEADGTPKQPKDWYELAEFAVKIKEATGKPGFIFPTSNGNGGWIFSPIAWSFGVDFMEKDENGKWQATFNTPEAKEALQYIKDLRWKYDVLPENSLVDYTEMNKIFATENGGMLIQSGRIPEYVVQYGMQPEKIGMIAMPAGPKRHVTLIGGSAWCMETDATEDQIDACIRWIEMESSYTLTDEYKKTNTEKIEKALSENQLVGIKAMSQWNTNAESLAWLYDEIDKKANANKNHFKLYNDFIIDCPAEIQPEEPVCCQELYAILDGCIQEILTNKDADCGKLLEKANADFQMNYLDNLTY